MVLADTPPTQTLLILAILSGLMLSYRSFIATAAGISGLWIIVTPFTLQPRGVVLGAVALATATGLGVLVVRARLNDVRQRFDLEREVKVLRGLVPICAQCKAIRDEHHEWKALESYIQSHSEAHFTQGLCPSCEGAFRKEAGLA